MPKNVAFIGAHTTVYGNDIMPLPKDLIEESTTVKAKPSAPVSRPSPESPSKRKVSFSVDDAWKSDSRGSSAPASESESEAPPTRVRTPPLTSQVPVTSSEQCRTITTSTPPNPNLADALLVPQKHQTRLFHYDVSWPAVPRQTLTASILALPARSAPLTKMQVEFFIPHTRDMVHIVSIEGPPTSERRRSPLVVRDVLQAIYEYLQQPFLSFNALPSSERTRLNGIAARRYKQALKNKIETLNEVLLVDLLDDNRVFYGLKWKHYQGSIPVYSLVLGD